MRPENRYEKTVKYWDTVFSRTDLFDPSKPLPYPAIENALAWLSVSSSVVDFGCGNGKALFRCLYLGAEKGLGIDISREAVSLARRVAEKYSLKDRCQILCGDVSVLSRICERFEGGILFNIIDNLTPDDGRETLTRMRALLTPGGKLLLKLNQYMSPESLESVGIEKISEDFYCDDSGLFLWNKSRKDIEEIYSPYFRTVKYEEVTLAGSVENRLFFLEAV